MSSEHAVEVHRPVKSPIPLLAAIIGIASAIATGASSTIGWFVARETSRAVTDSKFHDIVEDVSKLEEAQEQDERDQVQRDRTLMERLHDIDRKLERVLGRLEEQDKNRRP